MGRTIWTVVVSWLGQEPIARSGYSQAAVRREIAQTVDNIAAMAPEPSPAIAAHQLVGPLLKIQHQTTATYRIQIDNVNGRPLEVVLDVIRAIEVEAPDGER